MAAGGDSATVIRLGHGARRVVLGIVFGGGVLLLVANLRFADALLDVDRTTVLGQVAATVHNQLDLERETNIATWWSSAVLGVTALAAFAVAAGQGLRRWERLGWCMMGALLVVLSADEVGQVHESLARSIDQTRGPEDQLRLGAGDWIGILAPVIAVCAIGIALLPFFLLRRRRTAQLCVLAGLGFWLASIFFEGIEGGLVSMALASSRQKVLEEGCELLGTTLLLTAFLDPLVPRPWLGAHTEDTGTDRSGMRASHPASRPELPDAEPFLPAQ